jgi:hypothetical protein
VKTPRAAAVAIVALTVAAFLLRAAALPGLWSADDYFNTELALGHVPLVGASDREFRLLYIGLLKAGLWFAGDRPWGACAAILAASIPAVPLTWFAARRFLGQGVALLPAAVVAVAPVFYFESTQPSADAVLAAFGAALLVFLPGATAADPRARRRALFATGACLGLAVVFKEMFLLAALPAAAWLGWQALRRRTPWRDLLLAAGVAAAFVILDRALSHVILPGADRVAVVSGALAKNRSAASFGEGLTTRLAFGPLLGMTTDAARWGGFWLAGAAAMALAATGSARRHAAVWIAIGAPLVWWFLPVSLTRFALLPVTESRYLLCALPAAAIAMFLPFADEAPGRARVLLADAVTFGLAIASHSRLAVAFAILAAGASLVVLPRRAGAAAAASCFAAALVATMPWYGGTAGLAAWTFVVPLAVALVLGARKDAAPAAAAAAMLASAGAAFVAGDAARRLGRERWALRDEVAGAAHVYAPQAAFRTLRIAGGRAKSPWLLEWDAADVEARRPPPGAVPGDALVLWDRDRLDSEAVAEAVEAADPRVAVTIEDRAGGTVMRLARR